LAGIAPLDGKNSRPRGDDLFTVSFTVKLSRLMPIDGERCGDIIYLYSVS
jgi:hypothetical protein